MVESGGKATGGWIVGRQGGAGVFGACKLGKGLRLQEGVGYPSMKNAASGMCPALWWLKEQPIGLSVVFLQDFA